METEKENAKAQFLKEQKEFNKETAKEQKEIKELLKEFKKTGSQDIDREISKRTTALSERLLNQMQKIDIQWQQK